MCHSAMTSAPLLLALIAVAAAVPARRGAASARPRTPFRVVFSNDCTNIRSCPSPFHKRGEPFTADKLRASVDETIGTGIDVHMLQPGFGWVPWWKSKVLPPEQYFPRWAKEHGCKLDSFGEYMANGGDIVGVFVERCRERGMAPFISLRLNDYHNNQWAGFSPETLRKHRKAGTLCHHLSPFYLAHPEFRVAPDPEPFRADPRVETFARDKRVRVAMNWCRILSWAHPEVPAHKLAFVREICEGYDIDGFELDFIRHSRLFRPGETTREQRVKIVTDFATDARAILERTTKPGQHRWLCVRVPFRLETHDALGIDLPRLVAAGVDMVNLSTHYVWEQESDLPKIVQMVPDAAVYLELTQTLMMSHREKGENWWLLSTPEQLCTAAHMAYSRGGAGISLFNFHYYRSAVGMEPPFDTLKIIHDPQAVARQPQHYFLATGCNTPRTTGDQLPRWVDAGKPSVLHMDAAPPAGGWTSQGKLRIQGVSDLRDSQWEARLNGVPLRPADDVSAPYPYPYPENVTLGRSSAFRAWAVPPRAMKDGMNEIEITLVKGGRIKLCFIDLGIR